MKKMEIAKTMRQALDQKKPMAKAMVMGVILGMKTMWKVKKAVKAKSNDFDAYYKFHLPFFVIRLLILILQFMEGLFCCQSESLWTASYKFLKFSVCCDLSQQNKNFSSYTLFVFLVDPLTFSLSVLLLFHKLIFCGMI